MQSRRWARDHTKGEKLVNISISSDELVFFLSDRGLLTLQQVELAEAIWKQEALPAESFLSFLERRRLIAADSVGTMTKCLQGFEAIDSFDHLRGDPDAIALLEKRKDINLDTAQSLPQSSKKDREPKEQEFPPKSRTAFSELAARLHSSSGILIGQDGTILEGYDRRQDRVSEIYGEALARTVATWKKTQRPDAPTGQVAIRMGRLSVLVSFAQPGSAMALTFRGKGIPEHAADAVAKFLQSPKD